MRSADRYIAWRKATQGVTLAIFLTFVVLPSMVAGGNWLFRADFISQLSAGLAARMWTISALFAVALIVLTLLFGRVFCGWICALGTLADLLDAALKLPTRGEKLQKVKYGILVAMLAAAAGGVSLVWLFAPMGWAAKLAGPIKTGYIDARAFAILAVAFVALHLVFGRRAFCRIVCPLGAGLGVLSRFALFERRFDRHACIDCDLCVVHNRSFAISPKPENFNSIECFQCGECVAICPTDALAFDHRPKLSWRRRTQQPSVNSTVASGGMRRRDFVALTAIGMAAAVTAKQAKAAYVGKPTPMRPPGAVPEADFLNMCIRCDACFSACPTQTLQPAPLRDGWLGFAAPVLVPRAGGCAHGCNACGEACPTGAIVDLPLLKKQALKMGDAEVNKDRCLPTSQGKPCVVCSSVCPYEAIELYMLPSTALNWGDQLSAPAVNVSACTGCGLCEAACPVEDQAAIVVRPTERSFFSAPPLNVHANRLPDASFQYTTDPLHDRTAN